VVSAQTSEKKDSSECREMLALYREIVLAYYRDRAMFCVEIKPTDSSRELVSSFIRKSSKTQTPLKRPYTSL
jgi:hypothetical protein